MKNLRLIALIGLLASTHAWSAITIGDFALGSPKEQIMQILHSHFRSVKEGQTTHYGVVRRSVLATEVQNGYALGNLPIWRVEAFFNDRDLLNQVEIRLETTSLDDVKKHVPQVEQSQIEPLFKNRWEVFSDDGEVIYWVSEIFSSSSISFADKATSKLNIDARLQVNLRVKELSKSIDGLIDTIKRNEAATKSLQ